MSLVQLPLPANNFNFESGNIVKTSTEKKSISEKVNGTKKKENFSSYLENEKKPTDKKISDSPEKKQDADIINSKSMKHEKEEKIVKEGENIKNKTQKKKNNKRKSNNAFTVVNNIPHLEDAKDNKIKKKNLKEFQNAILESEEKQKKNPKIAEKFLNILKTDSKEKSKIIVPKSDKKENVDISDGKENKNLKNFLNTISKSEKSQKKDLKLAESFFNSINNSKISKLDKEKNTNTKNTKIKKVNIAQNKEHKKDKLQFPSNIFEDKKEIKSNKKNIPEISDSNKIENKSPKHISKPTDNKKIKFTFKQTKDVEEKITDKSEVLNKKINLKNFKAENNNDNILNKLQTIIEKHNKSKEFKNSKNFEQKDNQFSKNFNNQSTELKIKPKVVNNFNTETNQKVDFNKILDQIKNSIKPPIKNEITIQLKPDNLGKIKIMLSMENNNLKANITAEHRDVQHSLMNNMQQLETALKEKGINLSNFSVTVTNDQNFNKEQANSQFQNKKKNKFKVTNFENFNNEIDNELFENLQEIEENSNLNIKI